MAKRGRVQGSLEGLKSMVDMLSAFRGARVDVGYFAGKASRTSNAKDSISAGSKAGFYKQGTSAKLLADIKAASVADASTNPEIAAKMEFGVKGRVTWIDRKGVLRSVEGIPPRSTLSVPFHSHGDKIVKKAKADAAVRIKDVTKDGRKTAIRILERLGIEGENLVQEAYETRGFGEWAPNSPTTIEAKGSDAPLIDMGELRRSVDHRTVAG